MALAPLLAALVAPPATITVNHHTMGTSRSTTCVLFEKATPFQFKKDKAYISHTCHTSSLPASVTASLLITLPPSLPNAVAATSHPGVRGADVNPPMVHAERGINIEHASEVPCPWMCHE